MIIWVRKMKIPCRKCGRLSTKYTHNYNKYCHDCYHTLGTQTNNRLVDTILGWRIIVPGLLYIIGIPLNYSKKLLTYNLAEIGPIIYIQYQISAQYNSLAAYVKFVYPESASEAIIYINRQLSQQHKTVKASFGTSKYCKYYLLQAKCQSKSCNFIHRLQEDYRLVLHSDQEFKLFIKNQNNLNKFCNPEDITKSNENKHTLTDQLRLPVVKYLRQDKTKCMIDNMIQNILS